MSNATIVRKLTIKTCGDFSAPKIKSLIMNGGPEKKDKDGNALKDDKGVILHDPIAEDAVLPLMKISGQSTGAKVGQTDKGEYTKLTGLFVGIDLTTGEVYQSQACILPQWVGSIIGAAVLAEGGAKFAFEIGAKRKDNALTGYEYVVKPVGTASAATNQMQELMKEIGIETAPKLEAPKADAPTGATGAASTDAPATGAAGAAGPAQGKHKAK